MRKIRATHTSDKGLKPRIDDVSNAPTKPKPKVDKGPEQALLQRSSGDGPQAPKVLPRHRTRAQQTPRSSHFLGTRLLLFKEKKKADKDVEALKPCALLLKRIKKKMGQLLRRACRFLRELSQESGSDPVTPLLGVPEGRTPPCPRLPVSSSHGWKQPERPSVER